ncbi:hypothetical protein HGRIS_013960 [Hohenbuehelia grisea]|uniref:Aminotransferase-like plant mobile domain-containing protein n=1 Tax=Hohenbuehelia grisea TaxID=104357 RepID=A0ABR3JS29_9AGAR
MVHKRNLGAVGHACFNGIGIAFEFPENILAFLSADNMVQPTWTVTACPSAPLPPDIYEDFMRFLVEVVAWARVQIASNKTQTFASLIRDSDEQHVWNGMGVYTSSENAAMSGCSIFLTIAAVILVPSRFARWILAFRQWAFDSKHGTLPQLLNACIRNNNVFAPTKEQRLRYKQYLHVWARKRAELPARMAALVDDYITAIHAIGDSHSSRVFCDEISACDVFEPSWIKDALTFPINLGHLVFGDKVWAELGTPSPFVTDPLTEFYREQGLLGSCTYLKPDYYKPLFVPTKTRSLSHRPTFLYRGDKQIWSLVPAFPAGSLFSRDMPIPVECGTEIVGDEREALTFTHIVTKTQQVAIGPLEYWGNRILLNKGNGNSIAAASFGDQAVAPYLTERMVRKRMAHSRASATRSAKAKAKAEEEEAKAKAAEEGKSEPLLDALSRTLPRQTLKARYTKKSMTSTEANNITKEVTKVLGDRTSTGSDLGVVSASQGTENRKRRRSTDHHLVASQSMLLSLGTLGRGKRIRPSI